METIRRSKAAAWLMVGVTLFMGQAEGAEPSTQSLKNGQTTVRSAEPRFSEPPHSLLPPSAVMVTDDGEQTYRHDRLHATWTPSTHPSASIVDYQYCIQERSEDSPVIVPWTSVGTVTEMLHGDLSLREGTVYHIGVRAQADTDAWSVVSYSDGILVTVDTTPPTGQLSINSSIGKNTTGDAAFTASPDVMLFMAATDRESGMGPGAQMALSADGRVFTEPEPFAPTHPWQLGEQDGTQMVFVKFADTAGNWCEPVNDFIVLDTTPPVVAVTSPADGAVLGLDHTQPLRTSGGS